VAAAADLDGGHPARRSDAPWWCIPIQVPGGTADKTSNELRAKFHGMLHVDVLSAYLNCGVSALVGAAMLRIAATDDPRMRQALRICGWALVTLGVGLLPAGLGDDAAHPAAQFSLAFGSLAGVVLMARGLGQLQGRDLPVPVLSALVVATGAATAASQYAGPLIFGTVYAFGLAAAATLMAWLGRGFVASPRDIVERALGLSLLLVTASSWLRAGWTLAYAGPPQVNMLYVPPAAAPVFAALYGVIPIVMATLLLSLVNARLHHQWRNRALTDELTGAMTRRALGELAPPLIELARQRQHDMAVLMLDLDHFKVINDSHGHATGDKVLKLAASTLQAHVRHDALLARYGGEEFVALVPVDDLIAARRVAERLRLAIENADWSPAVRLDKGITVSVGVALVGTGQTLDEALQRADVALYAAKNDGRNRVRVGLMAA
jgi:diguanylate cyclase (GGDEF)-like protein